MAAPRAPRTPQGLRPVKKEPAAVVIAHQLTEAVMDGTLVPGRQLGEAELAGQLGVSRGPLREAMQRLVQQGILRSEPHRGVFVTSLTDDDVTDIYLARTAIEVAACRLVLRSHPQRTADRLANAHQAMAAAATSGDRVALAAADMELHQVLVAESGSPRLARMAETLFVETRMCLSALTVQYTAPIDLVDEHAAIIEALRDQNEALLIDLLDEHMKDAVRRLAPARDPADLDLSATVAAVGTDGVGDTAAGEATLASPTDVDVAVDIDIDAQPA